MATLDVNAVNACVTRESGGLHINILQPVQIVVGDYRIVGRQLVQRVENRASVRNYRLRRAGRLAVAARMRQLHDHHHIAAVNLTRGAPDG